MSFDKTCGLESKGITCAQHNHGYFFRFCNEVKTKNRKYLWTQKEKTERKIEIKFSNWYIDESVHYSCIYATLNLMPKTEGLTN